MSPRTLANTIILLTAFWAVAANAADDVEIGKNLVVNGGFENGSEGWAFAAVAAQSTGQPVTGHPRQGKGSYRLTNKSAFAPHVYGRVFQTIPRLEPFTTYRISCWVKGEDVGIAWIGGGPGWELRSRFPEGTFDWVQVSVEYTTEDSSPAFDLMIATESPVAALWIDEVRMEPVRTNKAKRDKLLRWIKVQSNQLKTRLQEQSRIAEASKAVQGDHVVQLGLSVADRFLQRIKSGGPDGKQSMDWTRLQIQEVDEVLKETELRMKQAGAMKPASGEQPWPTKGPVTVRNGLFFTRTESGEEQPFWFYGYGHFDQVFLDLPHFRAMGASIVQDSRVGPSAMNADGSLSDAALTTLKDLKQAARNGIKVDWLLSPHYFPEWAYAQEPEVRGGGLGFLTINIDHPLARKTVGDFADKMSAAMKGEPALFSVCLSNEPIYDQSGRDVHSRPAFVEYLKGLHGRIETLNKLYGTSYATFDDVPTPGVGLKATVEENRAYFDWVRFNQKHFADWHAWMSGVVKKNLPDVPTHAKIMVFLAFDRDRLHFGVDPELFCEATDLAGCDAYAFPEGDRTYAWHGHEFFYDLLHSFRRQPVFNSENHIIPDGTGPRHIPAAMTRAQFWQGGLHHQTAMTTWVWEEPNHASLLGSIYFRPANIYGAGRAILDLNRLAHEVAAINQAPPRVALLYSPASIFWEDAYKGTIFSLYTQLSFLGEAVTFVSERQLAAGKAADVQWILLPQATHVQETTVTALREFVAAGGRILNVGAGNLAYDEYHRPRAGGEPFVNSATLQLQKDEIKSWRLLGDALSQGEFKLNELRDANSGQPVWGVEFRIVPSEGNTLIPIINMGKEPRVVKLPLREGETAIDLLSGSAIDGAKLRLEPMEPQLLKVGR